MALTRGAPADGLACFVEAVRTKVASNKSVYVYNAEPVLYMLLGKPAPTRFPFPGHATAGEVLRILKTEPRIIIVGGQIAEQHDKSARVVEDELHRSYELAIESRWRGRMLRAFLRGPVSRNSTPE